MSEGAALESIRIDERTWEGGSEARRLEWMAAIRELLDPGEAMVHPELKRLVITMTQQAFTLEGFTSAGPLADVEITHDGLESLIHEYVDTVREIARADRSGGVKRLEALDMAKKVTHDKAGRFLERRCRPFQFDHPTARRLFTLLLGLRVDTTRLVGVHGHRRVR
ncbi:MAG: UPF0262 family protein [Myxococcota bacterium]